MQICNLNCNLLGQFGPDFGMALRVLPSTLVSSSPSSILTSNTSSSLPTLSFTPSRRRVSSNPFGISSRRNSNTWTLRVRNQEDTDTEAGVASTTAIIQENDDSPDAQDLKFVSQIKDVLERLKVNRDMTFEEVKLTIMIEDPRDVERRRLLGIDEETAPTRDDLATALEEVNEGKIPEDPLALQLLAEEMMQWPNLEVEVTKKKKPTKSLYAKVTDTGVNPKEAAKRLKVDWDAAAEIEDEDDGDDVEVPPAVGFGALYLVTAFPVIIGISVVLILFYNSLQ